MNKKAILLFSSLLVAALATASTLGAITLKRTLKLGDKNNYKLDVQMNMQGQDISVTADISEVVAEINNDGTYAIKSSTANLIAHTANGDFPAGEDHDTTTTYDTKGNILKIDGGEMDDSTYRTAAIMNFLWPDKPVDVGSTWTIEQEANKDKGVNAMTYKYSVEAREQKNGHDTFKIKFSNVEKEGGASSSGNVWIDVKSGVAVRTEGQLTGVPMGPTNVDASFTLDLTE
ncbi:MAG TPA: hypothetical protein VNI20_03670 [Fimbriimonadaceae bacterium]|nr:hypothetical protein [Fimbriimonadaceae bacterium]